MNDPPVAGLESNDGCLSYIGLKDLTVWPPIDDDDIVELQDVHRNSIRLARANAERSQTLRNLIEHAGTDNPITLPNVRGTALWNLETILNLSPGQEYDGRRLHDDALLDLLVAVNFLDLEDFIYQLLPVWANRHAIFPNFLYFNHLNEWRDARHSLKALIPKALYFVRPEPGRTMRSILFALPNLRVNISDELIRQFEEFDVYEYEPGFALKMAARNGEVGVVNQLLKNRMLDPNAAFLEAVIGGHVEVTKRMLQDSRVDPTVLARFSDPRIQELYQEVMKERSAKTLLGAPLCISCRVPGKAVMACGQCMEAVYCGHACQRADWRRHAAYCATKK